MKKFSKFIFGTVSLATLACGAYYVYKNFINKDTSDEFDEFEDEFEEFDTDEEEDDAVTLQDTREYVSINITSEVMDKEADESSDSTDEETLSEDDVKEETESEEE